MVFEDTLQPFVEVSSGAAIGYVLANQATIARLRDDFERAAMLLDAGAARFTELADARGEAYVLARRAFLLLGLGDTDEARVCLEQALEIRAPSTTGAASGLHSRDSGSSTRWPATSIVPTAS